ncbi:MAG: hypothetical protein D6808_07550 [Candidatus Dadabacteria bacterium]|nr:MAG: hypothetical protein D6808_07550 [Candidatus Dadabacteria bacterium]
MFGVFIISICGFDSAFATRHALIGVHKGMAYSDVLKTAGRPDGKEEYEVSRKERWFYGKDFVEFVEGKVSVVFIAGEQKTERSPAHKNAPVTPKRRHVNAETGKADVVEEILRDIMDKG